MKIYLIAAMVSGLFLAPFTPTARADKELTKDRAAVKACLANWEHPPFDRENPKFRVLKGGVRVFGIGSNLEDTEPTATPDLVLIKAGATVLSSKTLKLLNPHGWYCLKGAVTTLGKTKVQLACTANLTSSTDGATVLGSSQTDGGVTVLGSASVKRVGCKGGEKPVDQGGAQSAKSTKAVDSDE